MLCGLEGHSSWVATLCLCLLPDGRLASGSYDNSIRLWDVAAGAETLDLDAFATVIAAPRPNLIVVGDDIIGLFPTVVSSAAI